MNAASPGRGGSYIRECAACRLGMSGGKMGRDGAGREGGTRSRWCRPRLTHRDTFHPPRPEAAGRRPALTEAGRTLSGPTDRNHRQPALRHRGLGERQRRAAREPYLLQLAIRDTSLSPLPARTHAFIARTGRYALPGIECPQTPWRGRRGPQCRCLLAGSAHSARHSRHRITGAYFLLNPRSSCHIA